MGHTCNRLERLVGDNFKLEVGQRVVRGSSSMLEALGDVSHMWRYQELQEIDASQRQNMSSSCQNAIGKLKNTLAEYKAILNIIQNNGLSNEAKKALHDCNVAELFDADALINDTERNFIEAARHGNVYIVVHDFVKQVESILLLLENTKEMLDSDIDPPLNNFIRIFQRWNEIIKWGFDSARLFAKLDLPEVDLRGSPN